MNKKGFTVIELTVSFSLVSIIAIMLFNLIFSLKELYVSGDIKTSLLNKQAIMDKKIYEDLNSRTLRSITTCGISCLRFTYNDGVAELLIDVGANTIKYDDYTMKLNEGAKIGKVSFDIYNSNSNNAKENSVFNLNIPISTTLLEDDFGIHIVKQYNSSITTVNKSLSFNEATIIANGVPMELKTIDNNEDWSIERNTSSNLPSISTDYTDNKVIFAKIFHQENGETYDNYDSLLKNKNSQTLSTLKSLEIFRNKKRSTEITNVLNEIVDNSTDSESDKTKEKKKIKSDYSDGYFELIIDYPSTNNNQVLKNYNRWMQTSNFTNNKSLEHGLSIDIVNNGNGSWENGLRYIDDKSYISGSGGTKEKFAIGMKKDDNDNPYPLIGAENEVASVDLWIRVNEYIERYSLVTLVY